MQAACVFSIAFYGVRDEQGQITEDQPHVVVTFNFDGISAVHSDGESVVVRMPDEGHGDEIRDLTALVLWICRKLGLEYREWINEISWPIASILQVLSGGKPIHAKII